MSKGKPVTPPEDPGFPHDGAGDDDPGLPCGGVHDHQAVVHVPDVIKLYSDKCMFFSKVIDMVLDLQSLFGLHVT